MQQYERIMGSSAKTTNDEVCKLFFRFGPARFCPKNMCYPGNGLGTLLSTHLVGKSGLIPFHVGTVRAAVQHVRAPKPNKHQFPPVSGAGLPKKTTRYRRLPTFFQQGCFVNTDVFVYRPSLKQTRYLQVSFAIGTTNCNCPYLITQSEHVASGDIFMQ